MLKRTTIIALN